MQNVTTEKALSNQMASVTIEGFTFSEKEIENVRKCLKGELTFQQFKAIVLKEVKTDHGWLQS